MPCAAGVRCKLPGKHQGHPPTQSTSKCRKCCGYLHGICGDKDPIDNDDCKRVCEGHCSPESQRRQTITPKRAASSLVLADTTGGKPCASSKKTAGSQKRSNLSLNLKYDALEILQRNMKVKISVVARSTFYIVIFGPTLGGIKVGSPL